MPTHGANIGQIEMPSGARIVSVQLAAEVTQIGKSSIYGNDYALLAGDKVFVWAMVNEDETNIVTRKFHFISTGSALTPHELQQIDKGAFFTTIQFAEAREVYHILDMGVF